MAKSNWGITSGFVGKLGNVVGFNWKGINLQRALIVGADKRTEKQLLQRAKFALIGKLGSVLYEAVYEGFRYEARDCRSTQNGLFLKYNLENVSGTTEALFVNFEALKLSSEKLRGVNPYFYIDGETADENSREFISLCVSSDAIRAVLCGHVHGYHAVEFAPGKPQIVGSQGMAGAVHLFTVAQPD